MKTEIDKGIRLMAAVVGEGWILGEIGKGIKNYKSVATEQSWTCKVQHKEHSNIVITMYSARTVLEISGIPLGEVYDRLTTMLYI